MRVYTEDDFKHLISLLPNDPANNPILQALMEMEEESQVLRHPYAFEVDFTTAPGATNSVGGFAAPAVGASVQGFFLVDTSAPFMWVSSTYQSDVGGAAVTVSARPAPNQAVLIQDQSSNRNLMNGPVPVPSLFGIATLPYFLPQPRLIPANTNVQVTLFNYDVASVPNTRLTFHGYRLYSLKS